MPRWHDSSAKAQRVTHIPPPGFQSPGGQDLDTATGMLSPFPAAQERCEAAPARSPPRPAPAGPAPRDARGWRGQKRSSPCSPSPRVPQPPQTQATNSTRTRQRLKNVPRTQLQLPEATASLPQLQGITSAPAQHHLARTGAHPEIV